MGCLTFSKLVYEQWSTVSPVEKVNLTGKVVVIIGANTGIGFEASKHFARMNPARLILGCRNPAKGNAAVERRLPLPSSTCMKFYFKWYLEIKEETGYQAVELWDIDLSQFSSVKAFAERFNKSGERLDLLIQNAAIATTTFEGTSDGWESS